MYICRDISPYMQWILFGFIMISNSMMYAGSFVLDRYLPRTHRMKEGVLA